MPVRTDTVLAQCVLRAGAAIVREDLAAGRDPDSPATRRESIRTIWRSTNEGSKVAALIVMWALALQDLGRDEIGVEEFAQWQAQSRMTAYRRLAEFRRLWPEYDTPNELARVLVRYAGDQQPSPMVAIPVAA